MFAGPLMPAKDLVRIYKKALKKAPALKIGNYKELLWKPMQDFTDANRDKDYLESTDAQLLIVALVEGSFRILTIDASGPRESSYFGAIGTGADSAMAMLRWRKPTDKMQLNRAIYCAYEAKKLGEVSPHVGKQTFINVLSDKKGLLYWTLKPEEISALGEKFSRFGPQPYRLE
jgi:20S proteasome alpha/beta subunit